MNDTRHTHDMSHLEQLEKCAQTIVIMFQF